MPTARELGALLETEVQGYIHAYRAVTGVDLTADSRSKAGERALSARRCTCATGSGPADSQVTVRDAPTFRM